MSNLDLDKWLDLLGKPGLLPTPPAPAGKPQPPTQVNASLAIDVAEMTWRKDTIREVSLALEMAKNVMSVPRLSATLPGDMTVRGSGTPEGSFNLSGAKLRETLAWLGIDATAIPKDRLQGLQASGKLKSAAGGLQITDVVFDFDGLTGKAGGTVSLGLPVTAALQVELDRLDLDAYMPQPSIAPLPPTAPPT